MSKIKKILLSTRGRISASQYTVSIVSLGILCSLLAILFVTMTSNLPKTGKALLFAVFFTLLIWSCIALTVKRLHDRGHSGSWALLCLVPIVNIILLSYLIFCKGVPKTNRFGRCPAPAPEKLSTVCYVIIILGASFSLKIGGASIIGLAGLIPPTELQPIIAHTGSRKFYTKVSNDILLSKNKFSYDKNNETTYIMQTVVGKDKNGYHPPQLHIKQVIDGKIERDCLSFLFNKPAPKMPNDPRMSFFEYHLPDNAPISGVFGHSSIYVDTADPSWSMYGRFFGMGFISVGIDHSVGRIVYLSASRIAPLGIAEMVSEEKVETKKDSWEIEDDIAAAFGSNSNCDPLGHNRQCKGCLFQK